MRVFVSVFACCHCICICICICAMSVSVPVSVVATELKSLNIDVDCYVCHLDCSVVPQILVLHFRVFVFGDVCGWCATTILVQLQLVHLELINTSFCSSIRSLSCF